MTWFLLTVLSAFWLGTYAVAKKYAVRGNAVAPVLFLNTLAAAIVWSPWTIWSHVSPESVPLEFLRVDQLTAHEHTLVALKSLLVGTSWFFAYLGLKHLPISIAEPIRSTSPLGTIAFASLWMGERPSPRQWLGVAVILTAFYSLSFIGRREGIRFHRDRWVGCMVIATVLAAVSSLYDKYLIQTVGLSASTLQAWFAIGLVVVTTPVAIQWFLRRRAIDPFTFRWTIPVVSLTLLLADFTYFSAIACDGALISVISPLRRTSVVVTFLAGAFLFGEQNLVAKLLCVATMLGGAALLN
jgi:transporter family protein